MPTLCNINLIAEMIHSAQHNLRLTDCIVELYKSLWGLLCCCWLLQVFTSGPLILTLLTGVTLVIPDSAWHTGASSLFLLAGFASQMNHNSYWVHNPLGRCCVIRSGPEHQIYYIKLTQCANIHHPIQFHCIMTYLPKKR